MEAILNGHLLQQESISLLPENRAFCYGDGLFETLVVRRGTCPLLPYHYKRLQEGTKVLKIEMPFSEKELEGFIWQLSTKYSSSLVRMRLQLWRKSGGLYTPSRQDAEFLLSSSLFEKPSWKKEKVAFSNNIRLTHSSYSSLKTMNALPYVLAGLEKKERQLDDIVLTDTAGHVAECSSSNLFWLKNDCWYTPHLKSGCVAGVMRAYLLDQMNKKEISVQEVLVQKEELMEASALIATNATGLYTIQRLEYHTFDGGRELISRLIQLPLL